MFRSRMIEPPERCPDCNSPVKIKTENVNGGVKLLLFNLDGSEHYCDMEREFERHPIGQAVAGAVVKQDGFQLRGRRLTISFEDGNVLSVSAAGKPLTINLTGPAGIMQE